MSPSVINILPNSEVEESSVSRAYYRSTTASQRQLLFKSWEESGSVEEASKIAHVSVGTFYYWYPRFIESGYEGLDEALSHAPHNPNKTSVWVEQSVIKLHEENPEWGKRRIANELAKSNDWVQVISPNTVRRILISANMWDNLVESEPKNGINPTVRYAEEAGQTANVDLCFVPATHEAQEKLPAVSGSSGRLVIERPVEETLSYPGRVFEDETLSYSEAMTEFIEVSNAEPSPPVVPDETDTLKAKKREVRSEEQELRDERRTVREQRNQEDGAWKQLKEERKELSNTDKKEQAPVWEKTRQQRRETLQTRQQENLEWKEKRLSIREKWANLPIITAWIAVLVVIDNCTRQSLGLPLFVVGPRVTSDMVVQALKEILPPELQFLISDRGTHFTANVFKALAQNQNFAHVFTARHRPQSNGIAERFVRTLKEWLKDKSWDDDQQLLLLLEQFSQEYNDRPHLALNGLSPNEFQKRLSFSTSS